MRIAPFALTAVVASVALVASAKARADQVLEPCLDSSSVLSGFAIPPTGAANAPTNTTPIVGNVGALELELVDENGAVVPSSIETISLDNGLGVQGRLKRIVAQSLFQAGQTISVVADGSVVTQFNVGSDTLASTPDAPEAALNPNNASCGGSTSVAIGVQSGDAVLFIADVNGVPTLGGDVTLAGIENAAAGGPLTVFGSGSATVNVAGVDLAGHVGASTPVDVTFPTLDAADPAALFGCASTGADTTSSFAALAVVLGLASVSRRRRRR